MWDYWFLCGVRADFALSHPVCEVGRRRIVALRDELPGGPLASSASISGRCLSCLLLPGPFDRPTGRPEARLARRASFVRAEINPRSISAAIEKSWASFYMLGEFDFPDEKLQDTTGVLPPKKQIEIIPENREARNR